MLKLTMPKEQQTMRNTTGKTHIPDDFDWSNDAPKGASFEDYLDISIREAVFWRLHAQRPHRQDL